MTLSPCVAGLLAAKAAMRAEALERRGAMQKQGAPEALATIVMADWPLPPGSTVAGFWPMGDELDPRPLLLALHAAGHTLALPLTTPRGQPLIFRRWAPGAALLPGVFGTSHPADTTVLTPDLVLVPLLAFDARTHRLGYGGGYYDRTLATLPDARHLGIAYAGQQVPLVPTGPHDMPLHAVATERGIIKPG